VRESPGSFQEEGRPILSFEQNEAALMRAVDAWNSGDVDSYLELYDERLKLHAGTYDFPDKMSVAEMYRGFFAATADLVLTIDQAFGDGDKLCARYTVTARHTGELMGIPPTGAEISIIGITIMHFENGRVLERWDMDDSAELFARLRGDAGR
jgi:predicted ester cyclase